MIIISVALWSDKSHIPWRLPSRTIKSRETVAHRTFPHKHFPSVFSLKNHFFVFDSSENLFRTGAVNTRASFYVFCLTCYLFFRLFVCENFNNNNNNFKNFKKYNISEFLIIFDKNLCHCKLKFITMFLLSL